MEKEDEGKILVFFNLHSLAGSYSNSFDSAYTKYANLPFSILDKLRQKNLSFFIKKVLDHQVTFLYSAEFCYILET